MTLLKVLETVTVKDVAVSGILGVIGYQLYFLRSVVKQTAHKHVTESLSPTDNTMIHSETEVSDSENYESFNFGFQREI